VSRLQNQTSLPCGETRAFSPAREKAALTWIEALTHPTSIGINEETYKNSTEEFSESDRISNSGHRCHQRMEPDRDGVSLHAADTTRFIS
jgi:hypothetical protein